MCLHSRIIISIAPIATEIDTKRHNVAPVEGMAVVNVLPIEIVVLAREKKH